MLESKKTIVYGAGAMGEAVIEFLHMANVEIECILDKSVNSDDMLKNGIKLYHPEKIPTQYKLTCDFIVAISACPYIEIKEYLKKLGAGSIYSVDEYISKIYPGVQFTNIWNLTKDKYFQILDDSKYLFADDISFNCYKMALNWFYKKNEHKDEYPEITIDRNKYFPDFITKLFRKDEVMVDTSVLSGEYLDKFMEVTSIQNIIYGFLLKPNTIDIEDLKEKYSSYTNVHLEKFELSDSNGMETRMRVGMMKPYTEFKQYSYQTKTIDTYFKEKCYSFLRVYSMSPVLPIIKGGQRTIIKYRPIIAVNIGHYEDDFINVPLELKDKLIDYLFFFRMHSFQGNDSIFYAIPKERFYEYEF